MNEFFDAAGRGWGARPDVMVRVAFGINQAIEAIREHCEPEGPIAIEAHFDEFNLDVRISYRGAALEFPDERPSGQGDHGDRCGLSAAGRIHAAAECRPHPHLGQGRRDACWNSISFIEPAPPSPRSPAGLSP